MLLAAITVISILFYGDNNTLSGTKDSFSEIYDDGFTLEENEKNHINAILHRLTVEDSDIFGFLNNTKTIVDDETIHNKEM
jgi:hypothetical protein